LVAGCAQLAVQSGREARDPYAMKLPTGLSCLDITVTIHRFGVLNLSS
jgi:hypothetical protein